MLVKPEYLPLKSILQDRLFRIPQYQRAYSWTGRQRQDLFGDLDRLAAAPDDEIHFMATLVCLKQEKKRILADEFAVLDVVDGQQRLTTLVILLRALTNALDRTSPAEAKLRNDLESLLIKHDGAYVLLQTNHDQSNHFQRFLREGDYPEAASARTLSDRHLLDAMKDATSFVSRWRDGHAGLPGRPLLDLVILVQYRLHFVLHVLTDERTVYTVFEVLNARGLPVAWLDRLKSTLMGLAFDRGPGNKAEGLQELHRIWGDIYETIGLRSGLSSETLRFAATLTLPEQPSRPLSEEESVAALRRRAEVHPKGVLGVTEWLLDVVRAVESVHKDPRMRAVTDIAQARLLATAIHIRAQRPKTDPTALDADACGRLLALWEAVSFRIFGLYGKDARTRVGDYVRVAWLVNRSSDEKAIRVSLVWLGRDFPIGPAIDLLRGANCYDEWQTRLRYVLRRYEEHLAAAAGVTVPTEIWKQIWTESASASIEHIQPKSKADLDRNGQGIFAHRLGNLTLLTPHLNSKLSNKDPKDKALFYKDTGLRIASELIAELAHWDRATVEAREERLLAFMTTTWSDPAG